MNSNNKSKQRICSSLLQLLKTKSFAEIHVKDLVKEAGVARATFYLHYNSKDEVLLDYIDAMFDQFFEQIHADLEHTETMDERLAMKVFKSFSDEAEFSQILLQESVQPMLLKRFNGYLSRIIGHIARKNKSFNIPKEQLTFLIEYWAGGSFSLIVRWIENSFQPDIEAMGQIYSKLTLSGIKATLS